RYARPEMTAIWSPETKFRIWFEIEAHAADALAELGVIPKDAAQKVWDMGSKANFDVARIDEIEREVKHDVIAFLTHLSEIVGPEARFVHQGMTSINCSRHSRSAPSNTRWCPPSAAAMASTPNPRRSASSSRASMRNSCVRAPASSPRGRRFPSAPFPAPSAPSPISTHAWKNTSPPSWACK